MVRQGLVPWIAEWETVPIDPEQMNDRLEQLDQERRLRFGNGDELHRTHRNEHRDNTLRKDKEDV